MRNHEWQWQPCAKWYGQNWPPLYKRHFLIKKQTHFYLNENSIEIDISLTVSQNRFGYWRQAIIRTNDDLVHWRLNASQDLNALRFLRLWVTYSLCFQDSFGDLNVVYPCGYWWKRNKSDWINIGMHLLMITVKSYSCLWYHWLLHFLP